MGRSGAHGPYKHKLEHFLRGSGHRTYNSWKMMWKRYLTRPAYRARGVDPRWCEFELFAEDMGARPAGKTLDREDNTLGYSKENCRWATAKEQQNNRSNNIIVVYEGVSKTLSQLSEDTGVNYDTLVYRRSHGLCLTP